MGRKFEMMNQNQSLLTVDAIASFLSVSTNTIYYWVSRKEIPYLKVGKHLRFDKEKVLAFFASLTEACPADKNILVSRLSSWSLKTGLADLAYSQKE